MIQGLGASKNAWNLQRIAMATRFRIISFDNRGAGRSDKPTEPFTLEQMLQELKPRTLLAHQWAE
jgi:pimeloyl-ACP methyl ester carboxylesterase